MYASCLGHPAGAAVSPLSVASRVSTVRSSSRGRSSGNVIAATSSPSLHFLSCSSLRRPIGTSTTTTTTTAAATRSRSRSRRPVVVSASAAAATAATATTAATTVAANAALPQVAAAAVSSFSELTMANALASVPYACIWVLSLVPCLLGLVNPVYVFSVGYGLAVASMGAGLWVGWWWTNKDCAQARGGGTGYPQPNTLILVHSFIIFWVFLVFFWFSLPLFSYFYA